ncbi:hypothetical protein [Mitsuaria sp. GD03876]|uniref:hypothetical protein n=1 Tax=Mitsuaria sp. GD03876 TaxID=2975399 RepID=UPI00244B83EE|nr:hypothetical protein [Mitsuaria sp. GD03876]MDH0866475.1 hypothetical protein [Mitsuaria sp. GD03876]
MSLLFVSHADLPESLLREAWERMRPGRDHWPADFGAAMQDPLLSRLLRIAAGAKVRAAANAPERPAKAQTETRWPYPRQTRASQALDRKRAAAADRDD